jgi:hypothetical protein
VVHLQNTGFRTDPQTLYRPVQTYRLFLLYSSVQLCTIGGVFYKLKGGIDVVKQYSESVAKCT